MAQVNTNKSRKPVRLDVKNVSVAVAQAGDTTVLDVNVRGVDKLKLEIVVAGQALDEFKTYGKAHADGAYVLMASADADYTAPTAATTGLGIVERASGGLKTAAVATHFLWLNVRGLDSVKIAASSGNAAGSTVSLYGGGE